MLAGSTLAYRPWERTGLAFFNRHLPGTTSGTGNLRGRITDPLREVLIRMTLCSNLEVLEVLGRLGTTLGANVAVDLQASRSVGGHNHDNAENVVQI